MKCIDLYSVIQLQVDVNFQEVLFQDHPLSATQNAIEANVPTL